jgi:hypothetical protein
MRKTVLISFLALSAVSLAFAVWQITFSRESLGGLWLVLWSLTFLPVLLVGGSVYLWKRVRTR